MAALCCLFLEVVPIQLHHFVGDPQTLNGYAYVTNNPLAFTEPFWLGVSVMPLGVYRKCPRRLAVRWFWRHWRRGEGFAVESAAFPISPTLEVWSR